MQLQRQRGMTLIMGLIMLVVLTLLALTSFSLGKSSLLVVSNMQQREQNIAAARGLIEEVMSNDKFYRTPTDAVLSPCRGNNTRCLDINGDGNNDLLVTMATPICVKSQILQNGDLNFDNAEDKKCLLALPDNKGVDGAAGNNSLCGSSTWELNVTSTDLQTEASTNVIQGVAARIPTTAIAENCP